MDWCGKQQQLHGEKGWGGAAMKSSCDSTTVDRETEATNLFRSRDDGALCTGAQRHSWPKFKSCIMLINLSPRLPNPSIANFLTIIIMVLSDPPNKKQ